jgi:hypothetical protein
VSSAHAAEACNGNLESVRSHLEEISERVKMLVLEMAAERGS